MWGVAGGRDRVLLGLRVLLNVTEHWVWALQLCRPGMKVQRVTGRGWGGGECGLGLGPWRLEDRKGFPTSLPAPGPGTTDLLLTALNWVR